MPNAQADVSERNTYDLYNFIDELAVSSPIACERRNAELTRVNYLGTQYYYGCKKIVVDNSNCAKSGTVRRSLSNSHFLEISSPFTRGDKRDLELVVERSALSFFDENVRTFQRYRNSVLSPKFRLTCTDAYGPI